MSIIHLFNNNAKYIDKDSIYLYQDYVKYSIQRIWKLSFQTDKLYKSRWEITADKIEDFVDYIDDIFSDPLYAKSEICDILDRNYYHNDSQLKLF